jgi:hypothetical protein
VPPLLLIEREDLPHATLAAHGYARVSLLLPTPDEFPMNIEGLGVYSRHIYCFPQHFFELGVNVAEKGWSRQWGPKKPHRAGPDGLGLLRSQKHPAHIIGVLCMQRHKGLLTVHKKAHRTGRRQEKTSPLWEGEV